jgi:hypothetical protein
MNVDGVYVNCQVDDGPFLNRVSGWQGSNL